MSFLISLVAFAAIIAVYSTIVTVIVEAVHKIFGLRSSGLSEMLRTFYDNRLARLQPDDIPADLQAPVGQHSERASPQARDFALSMTRRAPSESLRPWYVRRWPLIGRVLSSQSQRMSALQFVERLAETPQGAALARHDREGLRAALTAAAYDYERLGEAQGEYFKSRAKMISVATGILVAFVVNIDAIALYRELSANAMLSSQLTQVVNASRLQPASADGADPEVASLITELSRQSGGFKDMGVPVGRAMFPHCEGHTEFGSDELKSDYRDVRCGLENQRPANQDWAKSFGEFLGENEARQNAGTIGTIGHWFAYRWERVTAIGNNPGTFGLWFTGILIAGGLLGLGAPFWFKVFARAANAVAPAARARLAAGAAPAQAPAGAMPAPPRRIRDGETEDPEDLERGFLMVLGQGTQALSDTNAPVSVSGSPPPGAEYGVRPPDQPPGA